MLKKECCKKCHQNIFHNGWMITDEGYWLEGVVFCPNNYRKDTFRKIKNKPPKNCHFLIEQILSNQKDKNNA